MSFINMGEGGQVGGNIVVIRIKQFQRFIPVLGPFDLGDANRSLG